LSFYLKGATPNVIIQSEKPNVDEKRALRLLRSFEQAHTGRANYRRPLVVPSGYKAEIMTQSIADQNFVELVKLNREDILQILRIPKHAVGLAESGSLGSEEHKQALKFFYTDSVQPRQAKIEEFLTECFRSQLILGEDEYLKFDNSQVAVLQEDLQAQAMLAQSLMPIWSLNEIRTELFDKEPLPEGESVAAVSTAPAPALPSRRKRKRKR
jgi:phage portal protein BeeE